MSVHKAIRAIDGRKLSETAEARDVHVYLTTDGYRATGNLFELSYPDYGRATTRRSWEFVRSFDVKVHGQSLDKNTPRVRYAGKFAVSTGSSGHKHWFRVPT